MDPRLRGDDIAISTFVSRDPIDPRLRGDDMSSW